jgi:hypothetical protein
MHDVRFGIVRGITCGLLAEPGEFVPVMRDLGAGLARVFLCWQQVEPEPGCYDWDVVDAVLKQSAGVELWFTVCSTSRWTAREPTDFLLPSPAHDLAAYDRFVRACCSTSSASWTTSTARSSGASRPPTRSPGSPPWSARAG